MHCGMLRSKFKVHLTTSKLQMAFHAVIEKVFQHLSSCIVTKLGFYVLTATNFS
jgi:hypothetical protein